MAEMAHGAERADRSLPERVPVATEAGGRLPSTSPTVRVLAALTVLVCAAAVVSSTEVGLASGVAVAALVPAALVDLDENRLPNRLVGGAALATVAAFWVSVAVDLGAGRDPDLSVIDGVATGVGLMAGPLLVLHLVSPVAMGFGDVKAAVVLGAGLGVVHAQLPLVALLIASGSTAAFGLATQRRALPFGPGLVIGSAAALVLSDVVLGGST